MMCACLFTVTHSWKIGKVLQSKGEFFQELKKKSSALQVAPCSLKGFLCFISVTLNLGRNCGDQYKWNCHRSAQGRLNLLVFRYLVDLYIIVIKLAVHLLHLLIVTPQLSVTSLQLYFNVHVCSHPTQSCLPCIFHKKIIVVQLRSCIFGKEQLSSMTQKRPVQKVAPHHHQCPWFLAKYVYFSCLRHADIWQIVLLWVLSKFIVLNSDICFTVEGPAINCFLLFFFFFIPAVISREYPTSTMCVLFT